MFLERDEMKFSILYTLEKYVEPISMPTLCDILTWEKQVMNYFDVAIMLNELIEDGFIESKFYRDERSFTLSERGKETNEFFYERVPKSVRDRILKAISNAKYEEQYNPNAVITEIVPIAEKQYMASLKMLDANVPMLELQVNVGSRFEAEKAVKILKKEADNIYKDVIEKLTDDKGII